MIIYHKDLIGSILVNPYLKQYLNQNWELLCVGGIVIAFCLTILEKHCRPLHFIMTILKMLLCIMVLLGGIYVLIHTRDTLSVIINTLFIIISLIIMAK